jgi:hypothetical protein
MPAIVSEGLGDCSLMLVEPSTENWCDEIGKPISSVHSQHGTCDLTSITYYARATTRCAPRHSLRLRRMLEGEQISLLVCREPVGRVSA